MESGLIFDIKRYSINDGPGIRVTVFFKGCNLNCTWCHNPESISHKIQKMYAKNKCISCCACVDNCSTFACNLTQDGIITDKNKCNLCGKCAEVCPTTATEISGRTETTTNILNIIQKETVFMDSSEGGVTFSGGEPLLQPKFLFELLDQCGEKNIHRAIDTAGNVKTELLLEAAKKTDLFLYDLKMMNQDLHKKWTGVNNELILHNLKKLSETGSEINIRIPLIVNVNDDEQNIEESAKFISALYGEQKSVNLLPYHNIAQQKYAKLGSVYVTQNLEVPSQNELQRIIAHFDSFGIKAALGG
ncbi:MAG: pyruvate formate lyase activating enzyme [Ignavibacteria bacterium]|nr:MAG: pyruvate formate lyase activating enzyme [Ignavibacteria bacterium]KAF0160597.1 MAG: pyruvate formate lyase activating enzyme [Ignavibacteria bacterium]